MCRTLARARELDEAVRTGAWDIFEAMKTLSDERQTAARAIVAKVCETLAADEHAIGLKAALDEQRGKAVRLLTVTPPRNPVTAATAAENTHAGAGRPAGTQAAGDRAGIRCG
jgi:hypothetical protein